MPAKKIIISVTNDLCTDQRVHRSAMALYKKGLSVVLVGRLLPGSLPVIDRPYKVVRFRLPFTRGPLFYATYNLRLFLFLLFNKADLLLSNDLDTLAANYLASKIKGSEIVYDSHEYFTGVPEIQDRPFVKKVWKTIEAFIFPKLKHIITVNDSIAELYEKDYGIKPAVIRNIPDAQVNSQPAKTKSELRSELNLPDQTPIIILQGAGINIDRGAEEAVLAMQFLDNYLLLIVGGGDVVSVLEQSVEKYHLKSKVVFKPRMPYRELIKYTAAADLGLTLDKDSNINYRFSLPNKLFDYIHAGIPVLASRLPEVEKIVSKYNIGDFIDNHNPEHIAAKIKYMLSSGDKVQEWKKNVEIASKELTWVKEEEKLLDVFNGLI